MRLRCVSIANGSQYYPRWYNVTRNKGRLNQGTKIVNAADKKKLPIGEEIRGLCEINTMTFSSSRTKAAASWFVVLPLFWYYREQMIGYRVETTSDAMLDCNSVFREARWDFLEKEKRKIGQRSPIFPVASPIYGNVRKLATAIVYACTLLSVIHFRRGTLESIYSRSK